jgi:hypothetical protein
MQNVTAIFELDEHNEATGQVYHYCSPAHANEHQQARDFDLPRYKHGHSPAGAVDNNERCCWCGKSLFPDLATDPAPAAV